MAIGDINGDGNLDLIVAQSGNFDFIYTLIGDGHGNFRITNSEAFKDNIATPATILTDLNGDGILDIAHLGDIKGNNTETLGLVVELGKGDGTFSPASFYPTPGLSPELVAGDFNRDGHTDIVMFNGGVVLLPGSASGAFTAPAQTYFTDIASGIAVDLTGDGALDVAGSDSVGIVRVLNTGAH
jgi:hypothetical protein